MYYLGTMNDGARKLSTKIIDFSCCLVFQVIISESEIKMGSVKIHEGFDGEELQKIYELCHDKTLQKEQDEVNHISIQKLILLRKFH